MTGRFVPVICLVTTLSSVACAAAPIVESEQSWSGEIKDESLQKLAPKSGFIADAPTWTKLWTTWRPDKELPKVDFSDYLILVGTVPGPNQVVFTAHAHEQGKCRIHSLWNRDCRARVWLQANQDQPAGSENRQRSGHDFRSRGFHLGHRRRYAAHRHSRHWW